MEVGRAVVAAGAGGQIGTVGTTGVGESVVTGGGIELCA